MPRKVNILQFLTFFKTLFVEEPAEDAIYKKINVTAHASFMA